MESKIEKYFSKHPIYNALIHAVGGIGVGALLTNTWFNPHPVRFGVLFIFLAIIGHFYAYKMGKRKK